MHTASPSVHPADRFFVRTAIPPTRESARLAEAVQRAREDERRHLARELHDVLGGELTAARLQLASLKSRLASHSDEIAQRLDDLDLRLRSGLALQRRIINGLEPATLREQGLANAVRAMASEFSGRSDISLKIELDEVAPSEAAQLAIYRLVQESLTNIGKYAAATEAEIVLRNRGGEVAVFVRDNGCGFDASCCGSRGHGLAGMRHRIESVGGHLSVDSAPGRGTRIAATLPVPH